VDSAIQPLNNWGQEISGSWDGHSMIKLVLCSLVLVTRLQDRSVDRREVVALVTIHGRLVLVDGEVESH